ncbi:hypothetical protein QYE76_067541 [Lolium multiflorum]|uniref:Retrovirus-related Pol polyprotein from transposon TNT 1-94 n=1 Tax=Lolium multiflorum TaxID=4521 RepID=A0AAD8SE31_LOLMU|nr:hypothetical protein QYE76_067541 [Lolium multiflorum]
MSSLKFDLPQLDYTTRFSLWQVKMRAILTQSSDLDEALDGFGKKDAKTWIDEEKRKDRKAFSLTQLHLFNNILQEVLSEKSAAALWLKLESICMSKDLTSKMHMKMKLFSHKLQEGASMMNHLSTFREIVSDLLSMEVKYDDEDLALILLVLLPNSFANFRDTLLYSRDELTLVEVYEALQQREKMKSMVHAEGSSSKAEALQVRGRTENRNNNYNSDKSKTERGHSKSKGRYGKFCKYCKKTSHNIDDCWKLQNDTSQTNPTKEIFSELDEINAQSLIFPRSFQKTEGDTKWGDEAPTPQGRAAWVGPALPYGVGPCASNPTLPPTYSLRRENP